MKKRIASGSIAVLSIANIIAQCTADFSYVTNWDTVTITNLSSVANAHFYWNFGDGSTSYEADPVHLFIEAGTFQVTLHALDTVSQCHSIHQEWMSISRPLDVLCEPFMTDSVFTYGGSDYVEVFDGALGCAGMNRYVDAMGAQNWPLGNWISFGSWEHALTMARIRYVSHDSIFGIQFHRAYYRTLPYVYDPSSSHDTCSADFEYVIDYQPGGAVVTFTTLGPTGADTVWVTGYGNPIPVVGHVSTFTFPYYGGPAGHWQNVWRRNYDPNYGCHKRVAHTLIIKDPYYVAPPSCLIDPQPLDAIVYQNGTAQFFISSQPGSEKQWQQNAGLGWQDLFDAGPFSGVLTDTLTVSNCQSWWSGNQYRCIVTVPGSGCHNTSTIAVLTVAVGIEEAWSSGLALHPNPATDRLHLQWKDGTPGTTLRIFDAVGSTVKVEEVAGSSAAVDISALNPGLYLLTVHLDGHEVNCRFVKTMIPVAGAIRNSLLPVLVCAFTAARAQPDSTVFDDLLIQALQGKMTPVLQALDTLDDGALGVRCAVMKHVLIRRFRTEDEFYDFRTTDTTVIDLMRIYQRYWTEVLLDGDVEEHDIGLAFRVGEHLRTHSPVFRNKKPKWLQKHWNELLPDHLKAQGYYAAVGKTGQFYDLLLHGAETEVHYPVTTPEDTIDVKVIFMDSVISNGWEGYATLDTYYPGGWATNDALYCARSSYDLNSENFTVSYLKHEGKHFADYKRFPKLQSADLEYRAKLVELGSANESLYGLIRFFLQNRTYDPLNPHAYANFCVMRDLSRSLFGKEVEDDLEAWKKLPKDRVHQASTALLLKNTRDLEAAGARTVKKFIQ